MVGTMIRRIQGLILSLRSLWVSSCVGAIPSNSLIPIYRSVGPAAAAFAYGLEAIVKYMLSESLIVPPTASLHHLMAIWYHYAEPEAVLTSIASLCLRVSVLLVFRYTLSY